MSASDLEVTARERNEKVLMWHGNFNGKPGLHDTKRSMCRYPCSYRGAVRCCCSQSNPRIGSTAGTNP